MNVSEMCRQNTKLSIAQIVLLEQIQQYLPFAASAARQEVVLFTGVISDEIIILDHLGGSEETRRTFQPGTLLPFIEAPLWGDLLRRGKSIRGKQEQQLGQFADLSVFPIVDNGGKVIGGLSFMNEQTSIDSYLLAETAYRAIMVPDLSLPELYTPLSYQDGVFIFDDSGIILYANEAASNMVNLLGFDRRIVGTSVFGGTLKLSFVKQALATHRGDIIEEIYSDMVLEQHIIPIISGGKSRRSYLVFKDRTLLRRSEQDMLVKNSVIKEIHHRVKNNLQTISGLLRMQARRADTQIVKDALLEGINRIESMSLVHEIVSHYDEDYIELRKITEELIRLLSTSMLPYDKEIHCEYVGESIYLSSDQASYISLILNELLSNSFEHGFDSLHKGEVIISGYEMEDNQVLLCVSDTGRGFEPGFNPAVSKRLGLQIIRNLVTGQLNGTIQYEDNEPHGLVVTIVFKRE